MASIPPQQATLHPRAAPHERVTSCTIKMMVMMLRMACDTPICKKSDTTYVILRLTLQQRQDYIMIAEFTIYCIFSSIRVKRQDNSRSITFVIVSGPDNTIHYYEEHITILTINLHLSAHDREK